MKKNIKGITLVALVVTIIVLLILAGIAINLTVGDNGLIKRSENAKREYENATQKEEAFIDNLVSSIKVAENDNAEITISMKDLKTIIKETVDEEMSKGVVGINSKSQLMTSINENLNVGEYKLNTFTNTFSEEISEYFEYNNTTGDLTCKQSGWYLISAIIDTCSDTGSWSGLELGIIVNGAEITRLRGINSRNTREDNNTTAISINLKEGDSVNVIKNVINSNFTVRSKGTIKIFKM